MSNVKVRGVLDECGVKNFMITNTDTGETHIAIRSGQKFVVGEFRGTLAQCKQLVSASKVVNFADAQPEPEEKSDTWSCIAPCALLIMLQAGVDVNPDEINRTLDAHGWLTPDGLTDVVQAEENFDKWSK
jgi:hypothetical protein